VFALCFLNISDASVYQIRKGDKTLEAGLSLCWGNMVIFEPLQSIFNFGYSRDNSVILIFNQAYDLDVELGLPLL